jgi:hypothetical protein
MSRLPWGKPKIQADGFAMSKNSQHVVPKAEGGWSVRRTGAAKATRNFESQKEAVNFAKELARKQNGEVYIHGKDGTIRDRNSYGSDPMPPRDKK